MNGSGVSTFNNIAVATRVDSKYIYISFLCITLNREECISIDRMISRMFVMKLYAVSSR